MKYKIVTIKLGFNERDFELDRITQDYIVDVLFKTRILNRENKPELIDISVQEKDISEA